MAMRAARRAARLLEALLVGFAVLAFGMAAIQLGVPALGGKLVAISGGSMEPAIRLGSLVLEMPVKADELRVGDVVTISTGSGQLVTHRIVRLATIGPVAYAETKGDANASPDPVVTPLTSVRGRMVAAVPFAGVLAVAVSRPAGWISLLALALALWLAGELMRRTVIVAAPRPMRREGGAYQAGES
jgi:signal peptidase I